jgi:hypothetical protein
MPNLAALHKSGAPEQYSSALHGCQAELPRCNRSSPLCAPPRLHAELPYERFSVYDAQQVEEIDFTTLPVRAEKARFKHLVPPLFCAFLARMCCVITKFSTLLLLYLDFMIACNNQC